MQLTGRTDSIDHAFEAMYRRHVDEISAFAGRWTDRVEAEDLVADTFVRAYQSLAPAVWADPSQTRTWLFRVLRNALISAARRRDTAQRKNHLLVNGTPEVHHDDHDLRSTGSSALERALRDLGPRKRMVLELRFVLDLDTTETATVLETTPDAVRALTHRALKELRSTLGPTPAFEHAPES